MTRNQRLCFGREARKNGSRASAPHTAVSSSPGLLPLGARAVNSWTRQWAVNGTAEPARRGISTACGHGRNAAIRARQERCLPKKPCLRLPCTVRLRRYAAYGSPGRHIVERIVIEKFSTGIEGLDQLTDGGFLRGSAYIVQGPPGAGTLFP